MTEGLFDVNVLRKADVGEDTWEISYVYHQNFTFQLGRGSRAELDLLYCRLAQLRDQILER